MKHRRRAADRTAARNRVLSVIRAAAEVNMLIGGLEGVSGLLPDLPELFLDLPELFLDLAELLLLLLPDSVSELLDDCWAELEEELVSESAVFLRVSISSRLDLAGTVASAT